MDFERQNLQIFFKYVLKSSHFYIRIEFNPPKYLSPLNSRGGYKLLKKRMLLLNRYDPQCIMHAFVKSANIRDVVKASLKLRNPQFTHEYLMSTRGISPKVCL